MMLGHYKMILSVILILTTPPSSALNKTNSIRAGKTFSLFSVVQFPNSVCTSTSGTYTNGTCITSGECTSRGGSAQGSCAAGFGVCCVYTFSATGSTISQNVSYLINPNYPSSYAPTSTPATISYTINKCSCDVCRLRLDFEEFQLTAPNTAAAPFGTCNTDVMTMKTTGLQQVSSTTGNYGNFPYICGTNTGQHAYIDMSCTCEDTATIDFTLGDTTTNLWKIKVTQLSCDDPDVAANEGCFQYLTSETGSFESYGLSSSSMICGHNYATCIRPLTGYCCIEYTPTTWDVESYTANPAAVGGASTCQDDGVKWGVAAGGAAGACTGAVNCQMNYVIIPGAQSDATCKADGTLCYIPPDGMERYCGTVLTAEGSVTLVPGVNSPVISCQRPFRFFTATGNCGTNGNSVVAAPVGVSPAGTASGYAFTYRQIPGNC